MGKATQRQIEFAQALITELGYDLDDYDFYRMSFGEVSELINELKAERGE